MSQTTPEKPGFSLRFPDVRPGELVDIPIILQARMRPNRDGETYTLHWCVHPDDRPHFSLQKVADHVDERFSQSALERVLAHGPGEEKQDQATTAAPQKSRSDYEERFQSLLDRIRRMQENVHALEKHIVSTMEEVRSEIVKIRTEEAQESILPTDEQILLAARHGVARTPHEARSALLIDPTYNDEQVIRAIRNLFNG
jgi:hypothetical protein